MEADMTTSVYAPAPSAMYPSAYGQPGYDQSGLSQFGMTPQPTGQQIFGQSSTGYGYPQLFGQQFGIPPQFGAPQQQFGAQPQFGVSEQLGIVQLLPQLLWTAQQNLSAALHLVQHVAQQIAQPYGQRGFGETPWARQFPRPYTMAW
jgi:hypothetical protein